jgi:hypothetical protein
MLGMPQEGFIEEDFFTGIAGRGLSFIEDFVTSA